MREQAAPGAYSTGCRRVGAQHHMVQFERTARGREIGINTAAILPSVVVEDHVTQVHLARAFDVETAAPNDAAVTGQRFAVADGHPTQSHILHRGENLEDAVVGH